MGDRHPAVAALLRFFTWDHLPLEMQQPSRSCSRLAYEMANLLPDGPEKTAGLRKLLEAKDCFVRAGLDHQSADDAPPPGPIPTTAPVAERVAFDGQPHPFAYKDGGRCDTCNGTVLDPIHVD